MPVGFQPNRKKNRRITILDWRPLWGTRVAKMKSKMEDLEREFPTQGFDSFIMEIFSSQLLKKTFQKAVLP